MPANLIAHPFATGDDNNPQDSIICAIAATGDIAHIIAGALGKSYCRQPIYGWIVGEHADLLSLQEIEKHLILDP